jgi:hypothetical protein
MLGNYPLAAQILASRVVVSSTELVSQAIVDSIGATLRPATGRLCLPVKRTYQLTNPLIPFREDFPFLQFMGGGGGRTFCAWSGKGSP